jgi:RsiW-degrading membrane proteinase PrsW (M82 family)
MGFALIEDADYGRAFGSWDSAPPLSHIFPTTEVVVGFVSSGEIGVGHAVWAGFVGLAIGFGVLYRRRFRLAWIAIPVALALAIIEHCLMNADLPPVVLQVLVAKGTLIGYLFPVAMIAFAIFEHRPVKSIRDLRGGLLLTPASLAAQRAHLAALQQRRIRAVAQPVVPVAPTAGGAR